jgi:hypothetical protein
MTVFRVAGSGGEPAFQVLAAFARQSGSQEEAITTAKTLGAAKRPHQEQAEKKAFTEISTPGVEGNVTSAIIAVELSEGHVCSFDSALVLGEHTTPRQPAHSNPDCEPKLWVSLMRRIGLGMGCRGGKACTCK